MSPAGPIRPETGSMAENLVDVESIGSQFESLSDPGTNATANTGSPS